MSVRGFSGDRTKPKRIVTFDLEWYPDTYKFRLGGIYDGEQYDWYETAEELLQALCVHKNRGAYIYSHFGGAADEQFLLDPWLRGDFTVEGTFSGGSMVFAKVQQKRDEGKKKHLWYFLDSYWTLRQALANIGASVGIRKTGEDYKCDVCAHPPNHACVFYAPMRVLRDYNMHDCKILHEAMTRFQDEIRELGGQMRATAASTALDLFRRVYLDGPIKTEEWVNDFADTAYVASRVEVIRPVCVGPAWFYDVNSSFPWSMTQPFPGNLMRTTKRWKDQELALVDATVSVPEQHIPPLGYRAKDGAIYHPTGQWRNAFTGVDLRALENAGGKVTKIHKTLLFEARTELAAYVYELYERRRKETDPFRRDVYKLLMNALYGKFGESCEKKHLKIDGGKITMSSFRKYVPHRWLPIGATITARSRQLLGKYLREAGDAYYCDTDSVVTKNPNIQTGDKLGELKREKTIEKGAIFYRPKLYKVDDKAVKAKGFSRLSNEGFDKLMAGETVEVTRMRRIREKIAEMVRNGDITAEGTVGVFDPLHPCDGSYTKKLSLDLRPKRSPNGPNETRPWTVAELQEAKRR